jgi:hypothetical protein
MQDISEIAAIDSQRSSDLAITDVVACPQTFSVDRSCPIGRLRSLAALLALLRTMSNRVPSSPRSCHRICQAVVHQTKRESRVVSPPVHSGSRRREHQARS